jgi:hypothetical protein
MTFWHPNLWYHIEIADASWVTPFCTDYQFGNGRAIAIADAALYVEGLKL